MTHQVFVVVFLRDRVFLYSPGCPGTHSVDQAGLKLRNMPASACQVLGLKVCPTTAWLFDTYCWIWGLPWSVVYILSEGSLEKTNFSFANYCQLELCCHLVRVGIYVHLSFSVLGPYLAWTCALSLHSASIAVSSYVYQLFCVWKTVLSWRHLFPLVLTIFLLPLLHGSLKFP